MPGRISTRDSTTSRLSHKSSAATLASRKSTASRLSTNPNIPDEGPGSLVRSQVCAMFRDAQSTTAGHRKLVVSLRKVQEACAYEPVKVKANDARLGNEGEFNAEITRCAIRFLTVRKGEPAGDRVLRFLGIFLQHATEKDTSLIPEGQVDETQGFPETPSSRLVSEILSTILPMLVSKEKTIRFRSTQLVAHIINSLDSIDDEYYQLLRSALSKRIRDKEPAVRVQAVLGLGRLAGNEDGEDPDNPDSDDDEASGLLDKLVDVLQNDPSAEVRRSLLLNLPLTPTTLPFLLERARDLDPATRRALYSRLLPALGDFRHLSLSMREKLLRWGLRDRDENVRKASAKLFRERWIEDCAGNGVNEDNVNKEASKPSAEALLELLERIDVVNSAGEAGVAAEAMKQFWSGRPDYLEDMEFDDTFWQQLTPEGIFMARSYNDFCRDNGKHESLAEEKLPEVTKLAFFLQRYTNAMIEAIRRDSSIGEGEDEAVELEFIVEQILHIALTLDYSDEVGRRKMFALARESLAVPELPEETTRLFVEILQLVCADESSGEQDFCGLILEAIAEIHDTILPDEPAPDEDDSFHSAKSEVSESTPTKKVKKPMIRQNEMTEDEDEAQAIKEIMVNMKCLHVAQCMLQNVEGQLQQNVHLVTMLNNLIVPAVRSHEAPIRERGLLCLGLCCLLDKTLAEENLTLFIHCFSKGHPALQISALHIICDILTTHPSLLSPSTSSEPQSSNPIQKPIHKTLSKSLKPSADPSVQVAGVIALSKLMLTTAIRDEDLLKQIIITFFDPASRENSTVRQALSYFLPVYAHSRKENMQRVADVAPGVIHAVVDMADEMDEEEEMVGVGAVGGMLVDWTDARKLVVLDEGRVGWDEAGQGEERKVVNGEIHLGLAEKLLERILGHGCSKEEKKALMSMLGKLYITSNSPSEKLHTVAELITEAIDNKIASDAPSRTALNKLQTAVKKALGETILPATRPKVQQHQEQLSPGDDDECQTVLAPENAESVLEGEEEQDTAVMEKAGPGEKEERTEIVTMMMDGGEGTTVGQDSLLEELLDDDGDVDMTL